MNLEYAHINKDACAFEESLSREKNINTCSVTAVDLILTADELILTKLMT